MATNTKFGKIVWAKVKGSCPWPAKGVDPISQIRRPVKKGNWHFVRFYGSNDHAWVDYDTHIWPYREYRMRYGDKDKATILFKSGLKDADTEYEKLPAEDLPSSDHEFITMLPEAQRKPPKQTKASKTSKAPAAADQEKKAAAVAQKRKLSPPTNTKSEKTEPASKPPPAKVAAKVVTKANELAAKESNSKPKITNSHHSPAKPPRIPTRGLSSSPRRAEIKAQVYDFDDSVISSQILTNKKNIKATSCKVGFIGLGGMGMGMVKSLIKHGHRVSVWNRTPSKCDEVAAVDVNVCETPGQLVSSCDITFACLSDPFAVKEVLFCQNGVLECIGPGKAFVDMSTVDIETVTDVNHQVTRAGGEYLEAPVSGTKADAANGSLLIMAAGNEELYKKCASCFQAMGRKSYYLGGVGQGTRMALCLNLVHGSVNSAVAEGMALADRVGLKQADLLDVINNSRCKSELVANTSKAIISKHFPAQLSMKHIQKDVRLAVEMADMYDQPLHVAASVNELYKRGKSLGLSNLDMSSVYKAASK